MISCSIIKLVEGVFQVWKVITGLLLKANSLYFLRVISKTGKTHFKWLFIISYAERDQTKYKNLFRNEYGYS